MDALSILCLRHLWEIQALCSFYFISLIQSLFNWLRTACEEEQFEAVSPFKYHPKNQQQRFLFSFFFFFAQTLILMSVQKPDLQSSAKLRAEHEKRRHTHSKASGGWNCRGGFECHCGKNRQNETICSSRRYLLLLSSPPLTLRPPPLPPSSFPHHPLTRPPSFSPHVPSFLLSSSCFRLMKSNHFLAMCGGASRKQMASLSHTHTHTHTYTAKSVRDKMGKGVENVSAVVRNTEGILQQPADSDP